MVYIPIHSYAKETMMAWLKKLRPELLLLIGAAIFTRLWQLYKPDAVVFDEVYFKAFAGHYLDGHYFFDIHPPLGKLILAGWAHILGLSASTLANTPAIPLRLVPAIFGICLIPLVWGIIRALGRSRKAAFLGGLLVLLDNALIVESRFILTDTILLATGLGGIYAYLIARKNTGWKYYSRLILALILTGASVSTKWTGLTSLALIFLLWVYDAHGYKRTKRWLLELVAIILIPLSLYASLFAVHFALLPHSGDGDAFMSSRFQSQLIGNPSYLTTVHISFINNFIELNREMYEANKTLTASHPYGSHWYSWPLELRPIYYWQGDTTSNGKQGNIYLLGNPAIWWGSLLAVISGLILYLSIKSYQERRSTKVIIFLLIAYLFNYLPFAAVTRVMFLYHYFFSLIFEVILAVIIWDIISESLSKTSQNKHLILLWYIGIITLITGTFIYFAPLTYGTPLSPTALQDRIWLPSWR